MRALYHIAIVSCVLGCTNTDRRTASEPSELLAAGYELLDRGDAHAARTLFHEARASAEGDARSLFTVDLGLSAVQMGLGDYQGARHVLEGYVHAADSMWGSVDSSTAAARHLLGRAFVRLGQHDEAEYQLQRALETQRILFGGLDRRVGSSLHYLALNLHEQSLFAPAIELYQEALTVRQATDGRYSRAVAATFNNLANVLWRLGRYDQSIELHRQSLAIKRELLGDRHEDVAISHANLGNLFQAVGNYERAVHHGREALRIYGLSSSNALFLAKAQNDLASALLLAGQAVEAEMLLSSAYPEYRRILGSDHPSIGIVESNLAGVLFASGEETRATALYDSALARLERARHPALAVTAMEYQTHLQKAGYPEKVIPMLNRALQSQERDFGVRTAGYLRLQNELARLRCRLGDSSQGWRAATSALTANLGTTPIVRLDPRSYDGAVSIYEALTSYEVISECIRGWLGDRGDRLMGPDQVLRLFDAAYDAFSSQRSTLLFTDEADALQARLTTILDTAFTVALLFYRETGERHYLDAAFRFSERSHAGALQDGLLHAKARSFARIPDSLVARERFLRDELHRLERNQARWLIENPTMRFEGEDLNGTRYAFEDSLARLIAIYNVGYPKYHAMRYSHRTEPISGVRRRLGPDRELIEYTIAGDSVYAIVLGAQGNHVLSLGSENQLQALTSEYLETLQNQEVAYGLDLGYEVYQRLVAPVEAVTSKAEWVIVPDSWLMNLPFEAVVTEAPGSTPFEDTPFLIHDKTITYAYSATLFAEPSHAPSTGSKALYVAAPVFRGGLDVRNDLLGIQDPGDNTHFGELRGTGREAVALDRLFDRYRAAQPGGSTVELAEDATETNLKSASLDSYRYVHFATHGYANADEPSLSGLLLNSDEDEDGVLHVGEVLGLELDAELVVLSACRTGFESTTAGQGQVGLGRAFMYAGARAVVTSLWNASDTHAVETVTHFYDGLLSGQPKATALRNAKLELMKDPVTAVRPGLWAPFVLIGN